MKVDAAGVKPLNKIEKTADAANVNRKRDKE
jgi:hypothetical protein